MAKKGCKPKHVISSWKGSYWDESGDYERQFQWVPVTDSSCSTEVKPVEREDAPQEDATEQPHEWKWMDKILKTLDKLSESPWTPDAWVREVEIKNTVAETEDWYCYYTWWPQCVEQTLSK